MSDIFLLSKVAAPRFYKIADRGILISLLHGINYNSLIMIYAPAEFSRTELLIIYISINNIIHTGFSFPHINDTSTFSCSVNNIKEVLAL